MREERDIEAAREQGGGERERERERRCGGKRTPKKRLPTVLTISACTGRAVRVENEVAG